MKSSDVYLCPGKLQSRFLLGIWAIPDLLAVIVCLLLMIPTRQFILFGGIIGCNPYFRCPANARTERAGRGASAHKISYKATNI